MSEREVTCPYCHEDFEVCTDEGAHYQDGGFEEETCPHCDKRMMIYSSCSWDREAQAADCLNTGEHDWSSWSWLWDGEQSKTDRSHDGMSLMRRYCQDCDKEEKEWHSRNGRPMKYPEYDMSKETKQ